MEERDTVRCGTCGKTVPPEAAACPSCGAPVLGELPPLPPPPPVGADLPAVQEQQEEVPDAAFELPAAPTTGALWPGLSPSAFSGAVSADQPPTSNSDLDDDIFSGGIFADVDDPSDPDGVPSSDGLGAPATSAPPATSRTGGDLSTPPDPMSEDRGSGGLDVADDQSDAGLSPAPDQASSGLAAASGGLGTDHDQAHNGLAAVDDGVGSWSGIGEADDADRGSAETPSADTNQPAAAQQPFVVGRASVQTASAMPAGEVPAAVSGPGRMYRAGDFSETADSEPALAEPAVSQPLAPEPPPPVSAADSDLGGAEARHAAPVDADLAGMEAGDAFGSGSVPAQVPAFGTSGSEWPGSEPAISTGQDAPGEDPDLPVAAERALQVVEPAADRWSDGDA